MALRILWTDRAKVQLREILGLIAFENRDAARNLARKVFQSVDRLTEFPLSGRVVPPCRVIYLIKDDALVILAVIRTERQFRVCSNPETSSYRPAQVR